MAGPEADLAAMAKSKTRVPRFLRWGVGYGWFLRQICGGHGGATGASDGCPPRAPHDLGDRTSGLPMARPGAILLIGDSNFLIRAFSRVNPKRR